MSVQGPSTSNGGGGAGNGGNGGDDRKRKRIMLPNSIALSSMRLVKKMRTVDEYAVVTNSPDESQEVSVPAVAVESVEVEPVAVSVEPVEVEPVAVAIEPVGVEPVAVAVEPVGAAAEPEVVVEDVNVTVNGNGVNRKVASKAAARKKKGRVGVAPAPKFRMVKGSHPLENSLVVSLVIARLDVKSIKTVRLVNKMWCVEGGKLLRKKTKVNFASPATSLRMVDKFLKNTTRLSDEDMSMYSDFTMGRAEIHPYFFERCGQHIKKLTYTIFSDRNIPQGPTAMTGEDIHRILHQLCPQLEMLTLIRFPLDVYPAYEDGKNVSSLKVINLNTNISADFAQGLFLEAVNLQRIEVNLLDRPKLDIFFKAFDFAKHNGRLAKLTELFFIDTTLSLDNLKSLLAYGKYLNLEILSIETIFFETELVEGITCLTRLLKSLSATLQVFELNACSWSPIPQLNNFGSHVQFDLPHLPKLRKLESIQNRIEFNPSSILVNLPILKKWRFITKEFSWKPREWIVHESLQSLKLPYQLEDTDLLQRMIFSFTNIKKIQLTEPTDEVLAMFFRLMAGSKLTDFELLFDNSLHFDAIMAGWDLNIFETNNLLSTQTSLLDDPIDPGNGIHRLKNLKKLEMVYFKRSQFNRIPGRKYFSSQPRQVLNHASFTNGIARLKGKALTLRNFVIPDEYLAIIEKNQIFEDCEFTSCVIEKKAAENSGVKFNFTKCSMAGPSY